MRTRCSTRTGTTLSSDIACSPTKPAMPVRRCRIASSNGWFSAFGKPKRGKHRRPGPPVHDDLCAVVDEHGRKRHVFAAETANELWLTDITEHRTAEGKLYYYDTVIARDDVSFSLRGAAAHRLVLDATWRSYPDRSTKDRDARDPRYRGLNPHRSYENP